MALDVAEHMHLFWITTPGNTHYLNNLCRSWADALDNFHYTELQATEREPVESLMPGIIRAGWMKSTTWTSTPVCPAPLLEPVETILHENGVKSRTTAAGTDSQHDLLLSREEITGAGQAYLTILSAGRRDGRAPASSGDGSSSSSVKTIPRPFSLA